MTIKYKGIERTHLRPHELFDLINKEFPSISAMTVMKAKEALGIYPLFVGESLYPVEQVGKIAQFIRGSNTEYRNGFLVFSD